ncbi:uncharacterized protein K452DRAFT_290869 [Aplosporella prunicola CBS 121167]|uniref:Major facilitator superfamily (MFS) profile domain-containing protein n=1 Tax=Aplosporella prunicola CBS 121167 TaxID=1176127 RepID=A0A6A6B266_9PEZI|nr:uncharacterized protein K452DRAFT_290869 [Aplosporella prunicola CBS 121167]KAF2138279.1 hypothetical protein K452DRAFT_290869 [Aplosporella prunicola CBS 121167]
MPAPRLPRQQFVILALCRFAEPLALTSVFPYLPEMVESFKVPKNKIAKWAGIASAIFSLGQCATSIAWGRASDKYGRKTIILLGLFNTMLTSLLWGFSTSLPMALIVRALQGAGNGNVGILRTMVAELCPWKELQPRAFSIMPLVYNVGSVFGPAIGGALANPLHVDITKPRGDSFFEKFPYALPNIVSACVFLAGIMTGILYLHETLASKKGQKDYGLILGQRLNHTVLEGLTRVKNLLRQARGEEIEPLLKRPGLTSPEAHNDQEADSIAPAKSPEDQKAPSVRDVLTTQSCMNLLVYTILAAHSIGYDQLLPVFMHHPEQHMLNTENPLKFSGGFGIDSGRIGTLFTLYGFLGILYQLFLFPPVARHYGVVRCFRVVSLIFPVCFFLTPFTALLPTSTSRQVVMFMIMMVKGCASTFAFPCSTILLTNSATSLRILGTLNGIATSVSAIGRAAGPAIGGSTFTMGVEHGYVIVPFWIFAAISLLGAIPAFLLIEGEGFGPEEPDVSDEENQEPARCSRGDSDSLSSEDDYGVVGELLSRTTTISSGVLDNDIDDDVGTANMIHPQPSSSLPSGGLHRNTASSRRGSGAQQKGRPIRRKTSVPIGMGMGFRRHSSNLGLSRDGYGTGQSWGG